MRLLSAFLFLCAAAWSQSIPENLKPPANERLVLETHALGDQVYVCQPAGGGFGWILAGPDAKLYDHSGKQVATHYAGPTWEGTDGSKVKAKVAQTFAADSQSIPWLRLQAVDHSGDGVMSAISTIQRLHTQGGKAPATGCSAASQGQKARVPYTADYHFYAPAP